MQNGHLSQAGDIIDTYDAKIAKVLLENSSRVVFHLNLVTLVLAQIE